MRLNFIFIVSFLAPSALFTSQKSVISFFTPWISPSIAAFAKILFIWWVKNYIFELNGTAYNFVFFLKTLRTDLFFSCVHKLACKIAILFWNSYHTLGCLRVKMAVYSARKSSMTFKKLSILLSSRISSVYFYIVFWSVCWSLISWNAWSIYTNLMNLKISIGNFTRSIAATNCILGQICAWYILLFSPFEP